ncbi:uncharacterized protein BDZ83DRAFT_719478 [Colletotrichum acutatum]|uniref:MYND-type domain-containing protein n=1 Tax=Glomerella acutata TaxID=27357 RepID=A0AAD8UJJ6_GLOAC|nr:uncharacterized protein BDZ83DRAFT_719478 [Colletotrichum acutatum]KAK1725061.1 hypothetical protein BDZ83DRAFT_719478 [Colletotrichum acutatum]
MVAPVETREFYKAEEHAQYLRGFVTGIRRRLDSGVGDELFEKYRALEHDNQGQYRTIVVGALMMRAGAKIKADDMQHLRSLPGTPRDFHEPSCFHCGKIHADDRINLKKCGHCQAAWYCGIDCQKTHRKIHKASCKEIWEKVLANV